jgi:hypothetical protein
MKQPFVATEPFNPKRPTVLVVCCSDGRFHAPILEFVNFKVCDRPDLLAVPGGPVILDPWASSFDEARVFDQALQLFLDAHDLRQAWLIAHDGCAYYAGKHPGLKGQAFEDVQKRDLRRGAQILAERAPHLEVHLRFARLVEGRVRFEVVEHDRANRSTFSAS